MPKQYTGGDLLYKIGNVLNNPNLVKVKEKGSFIVLEEKSPIVYPDDKSQGYLRHQTDIKKHQVICNVGSCPIIIKPEKYLLDVGEKTVAKNGGGLLKKGGNEKEPTEMPEFVGQGYILSQFTDNHIHILDMSEWSEQLSVDENAFVACEAGIKHKIVSKASLSSAVGTKGNNIGLSGKGFVCIESPVSENMLTTIVLEKDVLRLQSGKALAWSSTLNFAVEATAVGLVDVFSGSGKIIF